MSISINDIQDYLNLIFPSFERVDLDSKIEKYKKEFADKVISQDDYFLIRNEKGHQVLASRIFKIESDKYALQIPIFCEKDTKALNQLFSQVKERLVALRGRALVCRMAHDEKYDFLKPEMLKFGFKVIGNRVEYKTQIQNLDFSSHGESPLEWISPLVDNSMSFDEVADFMEAVAQDDPDFNQETDNAKECLESYLSEAGLYNQKDCLQIGFLKGENFPCCFIVAQVESSSGWSRITYMGVHPDFRSKGLGTWVQRHGVQMLKKQGGTEYHGGTNLNNKAMQAVFEKNGCQFFRSLSEWQLD